MKKEYRRLLAPDGGSALGREGLTQVRFFHDASLSG
jgi:hypothetical protein